MPHRSRVRAALFAAAVLAAGHSAAKPPGQGVSSPTHRLCTTPKPSGALSYGTVHFANSCSAAVQPALQLAIAKLHSFEAEPKAFVAIAVRDPACAMAWWGAAMSARGNPIGDSLDAKTLQIGRKLVDRAKTISLVTPREKGLVDAMDVYYRPYVDQTARARAYADAMDKLHAAYPDDPDIGALDGLAIIEGVDLNDTTYERQRRAGRVLAGVMTAHPDHPGAPHYLIHAYDYPVLAPDAVHAADVYPTLATASSHAQHMGAHIWSMLGRWDRSIAANRRSEFVADPSSAHGKVTGDIVFDHAFDFIAYARLQKAEDRHVGEDLAAMKAKGEMPLVVVARYTLERDDWADAARVPVPDDAFDGVLARFTRGYGAARAGQVAQAQTELQALRALREPLRQGAGLYWAESDDIYAKAIQAWILKAQGKTDEALAVMRDAAQDDDRHGKHIYLENKLLPMREALADMEMAAGQPQAALADYRTSLKLAPNRYRSYLGAARAAEAIGDKDAARGWWSKLRDLAKDGDHARPGDVAAKAFLAANG